jgi:epsin
MLHQVKEALRVKMAGNVYITLIHEATNEDPWGPTGQQMDEVTRNFHSGHEEIMEELSLRLKQRKDSWRSCYKSLLVIDHLARNVHQSLLPVISVLVPTLKSISQSFTCNEKGVDRGLSVRERSRKLVELLTDINLLQDERQKANATRQKVAGGPISVGSADVPHASPSGGRNQAYDSYDAAPSQFRNTAVATAGGRAVSLREEQERRDMELAARLQNEEDRRANTRGEYLQEEPVRVGRVKAALPAPSSAVRHPGINTQGLSQDEIDERIAIEMQRRLDAGEPLTPTLFQQQAQSPPQSGSTASTSLFEQHVEQAPSGVSQPPQQSKSAAPASNIDSFFDFGGPSTTVTAAAAPQQRTAQPDPFDPFAAHSTPAPAAASGAGETDFFDNFISQRKDQNRQAPVAAPPAPSSGGVDMFAASSGNNNTSPDHFEQQMRGLQGLNSSNGNQARPTLDEVVGTRQPLW